MRRPEYTEGDVEGALREVPHRTNCLYLPPFHVQGFLECDRVMRSEESLKDEMAGSTAVVVLTQGNKLWCGCYPLVLMMITVGKVI